MAKIAPNTKQLIIFAIGVSCFWLLLCLNGFPKPMVDDLFLIGAAIQLVKTGEFLNPLLAHWAEPTIEHFFVQTPFYSYILAGWLKTWGIHTNSFLFFQGICYSLFSIITAITLRQYHFSWLSLGCIPIIYSLWMAEMGLRHDALGMALLAIGLWSLDRDSIEYYLLGFTALGFAVGTSPVLIAYAVPFAIFLLIKNAKYKPLNASWLVYYSSLLLNLVFAFLIVSSTLLICIGGEINQFLVDMSWHASLRVSRGWEIPREILFIIRNGYGEVLYGALYIGLLTTVIFLVITHRQQPTALKWFAIILLIALGLNIWTYSGTLETNIHFGASLCMFMIALNLKTKTVNRILLVTFCIAIMMIYKSQLIISSLAQEQTPPIIYRLALQWSQEHPEQNYFIDAVAARFVFDYNLPQSAAAWEYSNPDTFFPSSISQQKPNSVWLISPAKAAITEGLPEYKRVKILRQQFGSVPRSPHDVMVIDSDQSIHFLKP